MAARTSGHSTGKWAGQQGPSRSACRTRGFPHPLSPQDLFVKYAWNNFLHFQVELCIAAILSHSAREDRAVAGGPEGAVEPPPSSGDPETLQPAASRPESTMVTHVGPGRVTHVAVSCMSCHCVSCASCVLLHVLNPTQTVWTLRCSGPSCAFSSNPPGTRGELLFHP